MFHITILTPVFNDWDSLTILIDNIVKVMGDHNIQLSIIVVDDGSSIPIKEVKKNNLFKDIIIIRSSENRGHQRAIATGINYVEKNIRTDALVVLDSDGEDNPEDIIKLIKESEDNPDKIVFASRSKRSENLTFKLFYFIYTWIFWLFTGNKISFGNFSIIPAGILNQLISIPDIWNHYAAAVINSGLPYTTIALPRGKRYTGKSKMNFIALIKHGLSSISVFLDKVLIRLIVVEVILILFLGFGIISENIFFIITFFFILLYFLLRNLSFRSKYYLEHGNNIDNLISKIEIY